MNARRARVALTYQGVDISADIANEVISATYADSLDEADRADIVLRDDSRKWLLRWKPRRTDVMSMFFLASDWRGDGDNTRLDCGLFTVDSLKHAGKPTTATIGGVSLPRDADFADTPRTRTWEQVTLSEVARSLLPPGYSLRFIASDDPPIEYVEQKDTPDCAFLFEVAKKYGFRLKLFRRTVILAAAIDLEAQTPSFTITESKLFSWSLEAELSRTLFDGCTVQYTHPKTEEEISYTFMAPDAQGEKIYESTQAVANVADAERVAKAELRKQNEGERKLSFSMMGDPGICAGQVCLLTGFGDFDGRYLVDQATHKIGGGYTTDVNLHRCLEGY